MEQPTDQPNAAAADALGATTPGEGLRTFLVPGLAVEGGNGRTAGTPQELALMFADLAARLALISPEALPPGTQLSALVNFQPQLSVEQRLGMSPGVQESTEIALINTVAEVLLPGVAPARRPVVRSIHHHAGGRTAAGLGLEMFTGVTPTDVERAELDALEVARAEPRAIESARVRFLHEAAEAGHVPRMLPAGDETPTRLFVITCSCDDYVQAPLGNSEARAAWRAHAAARLTEARELSGRLRLEMDAAKLGHVASVEPAGKMDAQGLVAVHCSCGDYRSSPGTEADGRASWRQHATAKLVEAVGDVAP